MKEIIDLFPGLARLLNVPNRSGISIPNPTYTKKKQKRRQKKPTSSLYTRLRLPKNDP